MKCFCWGCENQTPFGQKHCEACAQDCHHAIPTESRRVDILVSKPDYQKIADRIMTKYVRSDRKMEFSLELSALLMIAVDHGVEMARRTKD